MSAAIQGALGTELLDGDGDFGDVLDPGQDLPTPQNLPITSTGETMRGGASATIFVDGFVV